MYRENGNNVKYFHDEQIINGFDFCIQYHFSITIIFSITKYCNTIVK